MQIAIHRTHMTLTTLLEWSFFIPLVSLPQKESKTFHPPFLHFVFITFFTLCTSGCVVLD